MKRLLASLLILVWILCACSLEERQTDALPAFSEELSTLRRQVDYYEARTTELEEELADAKVELYIQKAEYEGRLQALERRLAALPAQEVGSTPMPLWFYTEGAGGLTITGCSLSGARLEIPASIDGTPVRAIGDNAFEGTSFSSVVLPDGVKEIGWFAFSGCHNLTSVTLPASVEAIAYGAFENCSKSLVFLCPEGSYAAAYARSYGFAVRILD